MRTLNALMSMTFLTLALTSCSLLGLDYLKKKDFGTDSAHSDCKSCHFVAKPKVNTALFPPYTDPSSICLKCHTYNVNHHPVNFMPSRRIPSGLPLISGEIRCLTCHEMHGGPQHRATPKFLRGGPYADTRAMCFRCHTVAQYANIDPHRMMDADGNRTIVNGRVVCLYCHELEPDPTRDRANMVLFRADVSFLCLRCHTLMHTDYFEKHFLLTPPDKTIESINRPEIIERFSLPLVPRGRITCTTCHNPHQKGIIVYGPSAAGADSVHRLRDGNVCIACH